MRRSLFAGLILVALGAAPASFAQESVPDPFGRDQKQAVPKSMQKRERSVGKAVASPYLTPAKPRSTVAKSQKPASGPQAATKPSRDAPPAQAAQGANGDAAPKAAAQEPEPPGGEPQPGTPDEPDEPVEPEVPVEPGAGGTAGGGALPRTGLEALWLTLGGIAFLLLGWRLHLVARVREVIRRLRTPKEALREELEGLLEAGAEQERVYAANPEPPVEPATPVARRGASG